MADERRQLGDRGEAAVARAMARRGYAVLDRQYRCRWGEIDIVARDPAGTLCFVEVKRRGPCSIGLPREFVDGRKQEKLRKTAGAYLAESGEDCPARFDVAEVFEETGGVLRIEYLENAFE